jgi:anaerobic selenocysteine-containing dehydrogenase
VVPLYDGIQGLRVKGDALQWGGPRLCEGAVFPTSDGRARFTPLAPPEVSLPDGAFIMSCRRGRQFNSMVQADRDPLTGARRNDVLMSPEDGAALGLRKGERVIVRSEAGEFEGRYKPAPMKGRNVQIHWPEANALIRRGATDPVCGIPDYHATVTVERM